jgi:tRNA (cytidine/uridine-2'-O-)-methyltransferase
MKTAITKTQVLRTKLLRVAFYQPDIPQNAGSALRLCAGLDVGLDIIGPCGFLMDDRKLKRAAMDYIELADRQVFSSWDNFLENRKDHRLVLMTTKTDQSYLDFEFQEGDILLAGSEGDGVPDAVHEYCDARVTIKLNPKARSLNVVNATAMIVGEALRQINKT